MFGDLVRRVATAHDELGHRLGWRLLYTPAATLSPSSRLAFVGLNPGGAAYEPPRPSVEAGNAYRVEPWGRNGTLNPLQVQLGLLYGELARRLPGSSAAALMDGTLAVNFCPFRSPSWEQLHRPRESVDFSIRMWRDIVAFTDLRVVLCLGNLAAHHIALVLEHAGARRVGAEDRPTGWGAVRYGRVDFERAGGRTLLVRLPHLSRFRIFGRRGSEGAVADLTDGVARRLLD